MADDEPVDNEFFDISTLSEAERRRLRRRQRILDNQGARLNRILKDDANNIEKGAVNVKSGIIGQSLYEPLVSSSVTSSNVPESTLDTTDSVNRASSDGDKIDKEDDGISDNLASNDSPNHSHRKETTASSGNSGREPSIAASLLKELSEAQAPTSTEGQVNAEGPRIGVQSDGSVILPKISDVYGKVLICLLAMFLSIFNAKRYLITFISWEVAYYFINGLPAMPPPNMVMVLAAVMGLHEAQLNRFKKILHFSNCVLMDFSLFLVFTMVPHIVKNVI